MLVQRERNRASVAAWTGEQYFVPAESLLAEWTITAADRMGSVRNVVDSTGAVIDTITYDGYGNVTAESSATSGGQYKYDGYRYDTETGLYRPDPSVQRYYSTALGVWTGRDPLGLLARDTNPDRYVTNNVTNRLDPFGLIECYCPPDACKGLQPITSKLNAEVNARIARAFEAAKTTWNTSLRFLKQHFPSLVPATDQMFRRLFTMSVRDSLAMDIPSDLAQLGITETTIEDWVKKLPPAFARQPAVIPAYIRFYYATCINVTCKGKSYCIGSDKIGHFFQTGFMLYELDQVLIHKRPKMTPVERAFLVEMWSVLTEGFVLPSWLGQYVEEALTGLGEVPFYGMRDHTALAYRSRWGGVGVPAPPWAPAFARTFLQRFRAAKSWPDIAANREGWHFWTQLLNSQAGFAFDICNYVSDAWLEAYRPW